MVSIKQGSIIKISLDPKQGHEQKGYRPYICLSHSVVTKYSNIAIFAPISNTKRDYPFYVPLKGTKTTGKVLLDQLVTIDFNARDYRYVEDVTEGLLDNLLARVKVLFEKG
ncbi:type II toxin-antitoxin system PemK/MazF family toxin [Streptococcus chenjunshii]|uniref:Type II toxin-antitoxin system PemK/MazF family toxin n=1 Tax=Streptococcus chenjunshii TaxID=2173853 RepID=A0A372KQJ3_9STRE|nr:type II toxin-antitoxin system PemK/MazF family toxin [Streptococcus chenjunshii]AXQ78495.1 type II toxin-antitoxin system PemK/MazF family toxin [Streptococcus chenjunshii]RFU52044.1 type II toxin-antitoxin system PemK/MazF family toxin [Streptococcus chenjunshii]RFU54236.1 type II toxin-antitoxin system PemK/MazF family toxin [Streptococcus chenjunshii]